MRRDVNRTSRNFRLEILYAALCMAWLLLQTVSWRPAWGQDSLAKQVDSRSWAPDTLPTNRHGHRIHVIGNELLVIGGFTRNSDPAEDASRSSLRYGFATKRWTPAAKLQVGKAFFGSAVVDGRVYAIGQNIERYDVARDAWEVVSEYQGLPTSHFSAAAIGSEIFIVGHRLWVFDTKTGTVAEHPPWPNRNSGDHFHIVAALGGTLHVIGGLDGETFDPSAKHWTWRDSRWQRQPDAPAPLFAKFSAVQVLDDRLYVLGPTASYHYDLQLRDWKRLAPMPETLAMPSSFSRDGMIHVLGGLNTAQEKPRWRYEPRFDRWSTPER